jgi:hypothetical protein
MAGCEAVGDSRRRAIGAGRGRPCHECCGPRPIAYWTKSSVQACDHDGSGQSGRCEGMASLNRLMRSCRPFTSDWLVSGDVQVVSVWAVDCQCAQLAPRQGKVTGCIACHSVSPVGSVRSPLSLCSEGNCPDRCLSFGPDGSLACRCSMSSPCRSLRRKKRTQDLQVPLLEQFNRGSTPAYTRALTAIRQAAAIRDRVVRCCRSRKRNGRAKTAVSSRNCSG